MKELSIEEKAKRYDEAIKRAKEYDFSLTGVCAGDIIEDIFPELAEFEDERMIQYFKDLAPFDKAEELYEKYGFYHKDAIAWLEKQADHAKFINSIQVGDKVTRNEDGVLVNHSQLKRIAKPAEKQGEKRSYASETMNEKGDFDSGFTRMMEKEQKPAWSEEDEKQARQIERIVHDDGCTQKLQKQIADWFKSLKDRVQPKQDWSKKEIENCAREAEDNNCIILAKHIRQLKSIRHQERWKPSDEQINEMVKIYRDNIPFAGEYNTYGDALAQSYKEGLKSMLKTYEEKN